MIRFHDWKSTLIGPGTPILEALKIIDTVSLQIALVVDADGKLLGTVTDGDVRRGLLRGLSLTDPVAAVMFSSPRTLGTGKTDAEILQYMRARSLRHLPVLDEAGRVVDLKLLNDVVDLDRRKNLVVIMAGGPGTRLRPLTVDCPKPLLSVGGRPILETIITSFRTQGFYRFVLSVNYKADMIEEYFGDGSRHGVQIGYVHEKERMGTAGALSLLPERPEKSFVVMNGDVLTGVDFRQLLAFHEEHDSPATMCVQEYRVQIPYGVVEHEGNRLVSIVEKPQHKFHINAGIYILEPSVLDCIPRDCCFDMPSLFAAILGKGMQPCTFPLREYWMDIGRMDDYEQAQLDFGKHFVGE